MEARGKTGVVCTAPTFHDDAAQLAPSGYILIILVYLGFNVSAIFK